MIKLKDVHKRYRRHHGSNWVLNGISLELPASSKLALIGSNGAGKSTLLRLIGGIDTPDRGEIVRDCRVSWPVGLSGGFQGSLTGRQNAKFVCRVHGHDEDIEERLRFIAAFSELGEAMDEPVRTYSTGMRARLAFAMSVAFEFDVYLVDEITSVGDVAFKQKARMAFRELAQRAGLIMVSHDPKTLNQFCDQAVWLHDGRLEWFDNVPDALKAYSESMMR